MTPTAFRPPIPLLALALALAAAPVALAQPQALATNIDCPPHDWHCGIAIGPIMFGNNSVEGEISVEEAGAQVTYPPANITAGTNLTLRVTLEAQGPTNVAIDVTVSVGAVAGVTWDVPTAQPVSLRVGDAAEAAFPFRLDAAWPPGDVVYIPVTLASAQDSDTEQVALRVLPTVQEVGWLTALASDPLVVGPAGLLVGGIGTWSVLRLRRPL